MTEVAAQARTDAGISLSRSGGYMSDSLVLDRLSRQPRIHIPSGEKSGPPFRKLRMTPRIPNLRSYRCHIETSTDTSLTRNNTGPASLILPVIELLVRTLKMSDSKRL